MTSNSPIEEWYPLAKKDDVDALKRRIRRFEFPQDKWLAEAWVRGSLLQVQPTLVDGTDAPTWGMEEEPVVVE